MSQMATAKIHGQAQTSKDTGGSFLQRKPDRCRKKKPVLARSVVDSAPDTVPSIVYEAQGSSGAPPDAAALAFMDPGFGHDFSRISVHSRSQAKVQTKLTVNTPGDIYEQEADRIADQVLSAPVAPVGGALPRIQRFSGQSDGQMGTAPASMDQVLADPGRPPDSPKQGFMEPSFKHDFRTVHVSAHINRSDVLQRQPATSSQDIEEEYEEDRKRYESARVQHKKRLQDINELDQPHVFRTKGVTTTTRAGADTAQLVQAALAESHLLRPYLQAISGANEKRGKVRITDSRFILHENADDFAGAWATFTGRPNQVITQQLREEAAKIGGFYDRDTKTIHLNPKATLGDALHEALHKVSTSCAKALFGNFINEGVTQYFADRVLEEQKLPAAKNHEYGPQLECATALIGIVGKEAMARCQYAGTGAQQVRQTMINHLRVSDTDFRQMIKKGQLCALISTNRHP